MQRDGELNQELETQQRHEDLRKQFADMANDLEPKLRENKAVI